MVDKRIDANDPRVGMTLGELQAFVGVALAYGSEKDSIIKAGMGWKQQLQHLSFDTANEYPLFDLLDTSDRHNVEIAQNGMAIIRAALTNDPEAIDVLTGTAPSEYTIQSLMVAVFYIATTFADAANISIEDLLNQMSTGINSLLFELNKGEDNE